MYIFTGCSSAPVSPCRSPRGRPPTPFRDASSKTTKRKRIFEISEKFSSEELVEALRISLRQEGRLSDAEAASKIIRQESGDITKSDGIEALAILMKADLTKEAYQTIR